MPYQEHVEQLLSARNAVGEERFVAQQLLELHQAAAQRERVTILELGVDQGQSTRVFLNAIADKEHSALVSVDVRDCSNAARSGQWTFVQSDSSDTERVFEAAGILKEGIDILYVDSLHTADHVYKEVYGYYPYLNKGAVIFFDDIDSAPYMMGQRKDSVSTEIANRDILSLVESIFMANLKDLDLTIFRGSTGLARLAKRSEKGATLAQPKYCKKRNNRRAWQVIYRLIGKTSYRHGVSTPNPA
ncbi:Cephalosporin hydroxylase [Stieleria maiorica]|uniref:Cephalosporin hydroxylase n=2 Tax=Stieleria maiorica TaxID=2795974 RepID=A0A5B9MCH5_9BACT|nr:Cephalosporin hydroxylase [Stieleria maiorica]